MKHIKLFEELTGKYKDETEIIYKDRNLVCLIPKSQMTSQIYGHGTRWCSLKNNGFDMWSKMGLLIRFMFKDGVKIRLTFEHKKNKFNWSNKDGWHHFDQKGDPFDISLKDNSSDVDKELFNRIESIPQECKDKVYDFIQDHKRGYDYRYSTKDYIPKKELDFLSFKDNFYKNILTQKEKEIIGNSRNIDLAIRYFNGKYQIAHSNTFGVNDDYVKKEEEFIGFGDFKNRLMEIVQEYTKN